MTLWIIDPSLETAEDEGVRELQSLWPGDSRLFQPALSGDGPDPTAGYDADAVVLMGSAASVYDDLPWMQPLNGWLQPIIDGEVERPLLGICFGHQLIAHLAGAPVGFLREDKSKKLGIEESTLRDSRLLPDGGDLRVVVSHREIVEQAPDGYRTTASRPEVQVDGIEHDARPIYSYQFHPEARGEFAERSGIGRDKIDQRLREDSRRLIRAFVDSVSRP